MAKADKDAPASDVKQADTAIAEKQDSAPAPSTEDKKPEVAEDPILETLQADDDSPSDDKLSDDKPSDDKSKDETPEAKSEEPPKEAEADKGEKKEDEVDEKGDQPLSEDLAPKSKNRFQRLANENRELREKIEKLTGEVYEAQSVEELTDQVNPETGQPYTVAQAADLAVQQQLKIRDFNEKVVSTQTVLAQESQEVIQTMPIFDPDSDQYDEELAAIGAETLEANLIRDPNIPEIDPQTGQQTGRGMVVDYRISPKQLYQTLARASGVSATRGQIKGQQDTEQMLANADTPSNTAPIKKNRDPVLDILRSDDY